MSVFVSKRDVVIASGPDAHSYLQGQISQDLDALAVGSSARSFVLQPQGKVNAWFRITRSEDETYLLDVEVGWGEVLLARLQRFLMRVKVDLQLATWEFHAYRGESFDIDAPIVDPVDWGNGGLDVVGPDLTAPSAVEPMDADEYQRLRILTGEPAMGAELNENTIPAEAGIVDSSVSFTKGCFTGQELVARIDSRGNNTPRNLRLARGKGDPPEPGAPLLLDEAEVGRITSAAPDSDGWVALAYVKRVVKPPATLSTATSEGPVSIEALAPGL